MKVVRRGSYWRYFADRRYYRWIRPVALVSRIAQLDVSNDVDRLTSVGNAGLDGQRDAIPLGRRVEAGEGAHARIKGAYDARGARRF
jgi:hypothetical protein